MASKMDKRENSVAYSEYDTEIEQQREAVNQLKVKVECSKKEIDEKRRVFEQAQAKHVELEAELHREIAKLNSMDCSIWQNSLPPELMEIIFSFVDSFTLLTLAILPLVCQWWRANALRYPVIDLKTIPYQLVKEEFKGVYGGLLKHIVMRGQQQASSNIDDVQLPHVTTLQLYHCDTEESVKIVTTCFPNLTKLEFNSTEGSYSVDDDSIKTLVANLPRIQYLNLGDNKELTDKGIKVIAAGLKQLKVFELLFNKNVTNNSLLALLNGCPLLTELSFWDCIQVTGEIIIIINNNNKVYPKLRKFKSDCITDGGLSFLAEVCPNITHLDLSRNRAITDAGLATVGNAWGHCLVELNLLLCFQILDDGLEALATTIKNKRSNNNSPLRVLNIYGCKRICRGLEAMAAACPNLVSLNIAGCGQVSPAQMAAVATHCPLLETLIVGDNESIDNQCIIDHVSRLHKLKKLELMGKPTLSPEAAQALVHGCPLLIDIGLSFGRINDDAMAIVAAGLPNLQEINVGPSNLSDASLHSLAAHCPLLTRVNICYNNITDEGIEALAAGCPRLRVVDICSCDKLTVRSLTALASHDCRHSLERISTTLDPNNEEVKRIQSQLPRLVIY